MRKFPRPNKPHHYAAITLVMVVAFALALSTFIKHQANSYAATYDSHVFIRVGGEYNNGNNVNATSGNHSFGTCNSAPGQPFAISIYYLQCDGVQFGPPDGVSVYLPSAPAGFHITSWVTQQNSTDGSVQCITLQCTLNFSSGTAYIEVDLAANVEPTPPTLSVTGKTTNSVALSWTTGSPGSVGFIDYLVYINSSFVPTSATSYNVTGLSCGTSYNFHVSIRTTAGNRDSNTVTVSTSACPSSAPPPASSPPPSSSPSPTQNPTNPSQPSSNPTSTATSKNTSTGSQSTSGTLSASSLGGTDSNSTPAMNAAAPPEQPANFKAVASGDTSAITLSWDASSGATHYALSRSTNLSDWVTLQDKITNTSYTDTVTNFSTLYYYRLLAWNDTGQSSDPAMTQVTSSAFKPNAGNGSDVTVRSDDGIVTVTIPSSALKQQANCSLPLYGQLPLYGYKNYNVAYGPYQLVCQQLDNSVVTSFQTPLYASLALPQDAGGKYAALSVAAYDAGSSNWKTISANYNPSSQKPLELPLQFGGIVVMGKQKTVPILLISLGVVTALLVGGYIGLRRFAKLKIAKQIKARQEDYWRKMNGF